MAIFFLPLSVRGDIEEVSTWAPLPSTFPKSQRYCPAGFGFLLHRSSFLWLLPLPFINCTARRDTSGSLLALTVSLSQISYTLWTGLEFSGSGGVWQRVWRRFQQRYQRSYCCLCCHHTGRGGRWVTFFLSHPWLTLKKRCRLWERWLSGLLPNPSSVFVYSPLSLEAEVLRWLIPPQRGTEVYFYRASIKCW